MKRLGEQPGAPRHALWPRRRVLGAGLAAALPWLGGCATPLPLDPPPNPAPDGDGVALLQRSAEAHGLDAYRKLNDVNVRYNGQWRPLVDRIQPVLVDKGFRGASEERLLPSAGIVAQAYTGASGAKQVVFRGSTALPTDAAARRVDVWLNGQPSEDRDVLDASALVADAYGLFLFGPLWIHGRSELVRRAGSERVDGSLCEIVDVWLRPGLGRSALDRVSMSIDSGGRMRRVRLTLEGFAGTRGAVAQVDTFDHERRFGMLWPMRSYEEVVHPLSLPAHDWHIAGLDVDRGYDAPAITGSAFTGAAALPAASR